MRATPSTPRAGGAHDKQEVISITATYDVEYVYKKMDAIKSKFERDY